MNKCLANSFTQHDTHFSTPLYFVMAEYISKGDHHLNSLPTPIVIQHPLRTVRHFSELMNYTM